MISILRFQKTSNSTNQITALNIIKIQVYLGFLLLKNNFNIDSLSCSSTIYSYIAIAD